MTCLRNLFNRSTLRVNAAYRARGRACVAFATPDNSRAEIQAPDVRKLAKLAQIEVTDEEVAKWEPQLEEIVKWFDQLQQVDVENVPPCTRASLANLLAAGQDEPVEYSEREALLQSAPTREGPFVKVPKIM